MNPKMRKLAQKAYLSNLNTPTQTQDNFQQMLQLAGRFSADVKETQLGNEWGEILDGQEPGMGQ